jgi:hypothetical protein
MYILIHSVARAGGVPLAAELHADRQAEIQPIRERQDWLRPLVARLGALAEHLLEKGQTRIAAARHPAPGLPA